MRYSEEFKQKVLSVLGENAEIKRMLDTDNAFIGNYLDAARYEGISAKEIVAAIENAQYQELYQKAKRQLIVEELYTEWSEMYRKQNSGMHR